MDPLNNIIEELEALGQKELSNEIKAVTEVQGDAIDDKIDNKIEDLKKIVDTLTHTLNEEQNEFKTYDDAGKEELNTWLDNLESKLILV